MGIQLYSYVVLYEMENKTVYTYKKPTHVSQIPITYHS